MLYCWCVDYSNPNVEATLLQTIRIIKAQISRARCGKGHSGNTSLEAIQGNTLAECQGCGSIYTAEQVAAARSGIPGEGGVILR